MCIGWYNILQYANKSLSHEVFLHVLATPAVTQLTACSLSSFLPLYVHYPLIQKGHDFSKLLDLLFCIQCILKCNARIVYFLCFSGCAVCVDLKISLPSLSDLHVTLSIVLPAHALRYCIYMHTHACTLLWY